MICVICRQAEIIEGFTAIKFERGEMHLVINNVPARICPSCGEAFVGEDVAKRLLHMGMEMSEVGRLEAHCEYRAS
jgi:YgiT-type zinc finger domain-containing protein